MLAIINRSIKDRRIVILVYILASIALVYMYIALFPSVNNIKSAALDNVPQGVTKAFNFDINSLTTIQGFLSTEQFSFMWPILTICLLVGYAGAAFAGEIEKGTIEILLSQPVTRAKLFLAKYFAGLGMMIVYVFLSVYIAVPLSRINNLDAPSHNFLTMTLLAMLFAWAIYSVGMLLTTIFSDKGKVFFISGVILAAMYVIKIVAALKDSLSGLKYTSFFYYFDPAKALIYNQIDNWSYLVFIGVAVVCFLAGLLCFRRRDMAT